MSGPSERKPEPHPGVAASAITAMSLAVAAVMEFAGPVVWLDAWLRARVEGFGLEGAARPLVPGLVWGWTVLLCLGLSQAMLHTRGSGRRWLLAALALLVTLAWLPVLALAAYEAPLGVPLFGLLWVVAGSSIYAERHREPD